MESTKCPSCGLLSLPGTLECRRCKAPLTPPPLSPIGIPRAKTTASPIGRLLAGVVGAIIGTTAMTMGVPWCRNELFSSYKPDWRTVSPPTAGFSVSMPGPPREAVETLPTAIGDTELRSYTVDFGRAGAFAAASISFPAVAGQATPDEMLDGMANGVVTNTKSRLISKEPISLGRFQGVEIFAAPPGPPSARMVVRMYWIPPNRACYVTVIAMSGGRLMEDRERMFQSLQIDDGR